jgi:hypothetical protein
MCRLKDLFYLFYLLLGEDVGQRDTPIPVEGFDLFGCESVAVRCSGVCDPPWHLPDGEESGERRECGAGPPFLLT